jgi:hypothetical protein
MEISMEFTRRITFCSLLSTLLVCPFLRPADAERPKDVDTKAIEALISKLKSSNKDPNPKNESGLREFPKEYDIKAQKAVDLARKELKEMGKDAFPMLIEHVQDKGYSRTILTSIQRSLSVGAVCFMLIEDQVDIGGMRYKWREGVDGKTHLHRGYFSQYCGDAWFTQEGLKKWWKENQNYSLKEMQIAALKWDIVREKEIGFPGKDDKKNYLEPLEQKLAELTTK